MSIFVIRGPKGSGKTVIAESLRHKAVAEHRATLIVDDKHAALPVDDLVNKLLVAPLPESKEPAPAESLRWKDRPLILFAGAGVGVLDAIEARVPGFSALLGPVTGVDLSVIAGATKPKGKRN